MTRELIEVMWVLLLENDEQDKQVVPVASLEEEQEDTDQEEKEMELDPDAAYHPQDDSKRSPLFVLLLLTLYLSVKVMMNFRLMPWRMSRMMKDFDVIKSPKRCLKNLRKSMYILMHSRF